MARLTNDPIAHSTVVIVSGFKRIFDVGPKVGTMSA
jgi:hypothetical protein